MCSKLKKNVFVGVFALGVCSVWTVGLLSANASQAYTLAPDVYSGDWNPFDGDHLVVTVYGCNLAQHADEQIYVHNLKVETKNDEGSTHDYTYSTSTFAEGQRENSRSPFSKTQESPWSDKYDLYARVNCTNSEVYCTGCLGADNSVGYGTGDDPSPWIKEN